MSHVVYWTGVGLGHTALARGDCDAARQHATRAWEAEGTLPYSQAGYVLADSQLGSGEPGGAAVTLDAFGWVNPTLWPLDRLRALEVSVRVLLALERTEEASELVNGWPAEVGGRRTGIFGAIGYRAEALVRRAQSDSRAAAALAPGRCRRGRRGARAFVVGPLPHGGGRSPERPRLGRRGP
jgi:hypothetical protein